MTTKSKTKAAPTDHQRKVHAARERLRRAIKAYGPRDKRTLTTQRELAALLTATAVKPVPPKIKIIAPDGEELAPEDVTSTHDARWRAQAKAKAEREAEAKAQIKEEPAPTLTERVTAALPAVKAKAPAPKAAPIGAVGVYGKPGSAAEAYKRLIMAGGMTDQDIYDQVVKELGEDRAGQLSYVSWYVRWLTQHGYTPPTRVR